MAEPVTALAGIPAATGSGRVTLAESPAATILRVQTWPDTTEAFARVAQDVLGIAPPPLGRVATSGAQSMAAIAPGAFVILGLTQEFTWLLQEGLPARDAAITDWSHARTLMSLSGEGAADLLQTCVAIDLAALPPGRAAATMIHHIDVLILRVSATEFRLLALRSFAESLAEWLLDAGSEIGAGFRPI